MAKLTPHTRVSTAPSALGPRLAGRPTPRTPQIGGPAYARNVAVAAEPSGGRRALLLGLGAGALAGAVLGAARPAEAGQGVVDERSRSMSTAWGPVADLGADEEATCPKQFGGRYAPIIEGVALVGATVGGYVAYLRKKEVEALNEKLRLINQSLRKQARSGSPSVPPLSYTPPAAGGAPGDATSSTNNNGSTGGTATLQQTHPALMSTVDEDLSPEQLSMIESMKHGRAQLNAGDAAGAHSTFSQALAVAQKLGDVVRERRATRGLAAASRLEGDVEKAINYFKAVLALSDTMGEHTGDSGAYGSIADLYTELGEFEEAATYYDKYLELMEDDAGVI